MYKKMNVLVEVEHIGITQLKDLTDFLMACIEANKCIMCSIHVTLDEETN